MNTHVDDNDNILIESTSLETDCIDFGSRALHHEDVPESDHYNAYDSNMPRAKELVSLVDASKIPKERGVLVEWALDKIISTEKANMASEKPPPRGTVVSGCPVEKCAKHMSLHGIFNIFVLQRRLFDGQILIFKGASQQVTVLSYKGDYLV
jgi:hypothetical protein